jgi:CspA family cold shock protein
MPDSDFVIGLVKWFDAAKGYGFVVSNGRDVFVHSKRLRESGLVAKPEASHITLDPGDKLQFKIENGPKGAFATEISKVLT